MKYLLFLSTLLYSLVGVAQLKNIGFERYKLEQGLSHTTIYSILQDEKGYIWMGTKDGLNRFDGYKFTKYQYHSTDSNSLSGSVVLTLFIDSKKRFWVGTNAGLNIFDLYTQNNKRIPYYVTDGSGTTNNVIWSIAEHPNGDIYFATNKGLNYWSESEQRFKVANHPDLWQERINLVRIGKDGRIVIGTQGNGLQVWDVQNNRIDTYNKKTGLLGNEVRGLLKDKKGRIWIASDKALYKYLPETKKLEVFSQKEGNLATGNTNCLLQDKDGLIWVGTWGEGISLYNEESNSFETHKHNARVASSLPDNFVNFMFEDNTGAIWVATSGGIGRYDKNRKNFVSYKYEVGVKQSLSSNIINNIFRDREGYLWVATKTGGLNRMRSDGMSFDHFQHSKTNSNSIISNRVNRLSQAPNGEIWMATSKGVSVLQPKTKQVRNYARGASVALSASYIQTVLCDSAGNIWIGTVSGLDRYLGETAPYFESVKLLQDIEPNSATYLINNIIEGEDGKLWIGTFGKGLLHYDPKTKKTVAYQYNAYKNSISNNDIYYIHLDADTVWIGTNGSGLDKLDLSTGKFSNINTKHGLPNNVINGIESDKRGFLWVSTNEGLARVTRHTRKVKSYDADYGLQSNLFRRRASWCDTDGRIYFGGRQGLTAFYPNEISDNPIKPVVHVQDIQVFDLNHNTTNVKKINTASDKHIEQKYYQNNFIVDFIGVSYSLSKRNTYKYKLVGFDSQWKDAGNRRHAEYTNVPPGEYMFRVIAANSDGLWNEDGDAIQITILPPWWETWWAIILEVLSIALVIGLVVRWRTNYYKKQKKQLEDVVKARTFELFESREELRSQRDELQQQTAVLERQSQQITDSIVYAERMQRSLLESGNKISELLPDNFIFFQPKGIVSGDFYWSGYIGSKFTIVAADCTGHGVPGAILSVLGIAFFNEIAAMNRNLKAGQVLDILRDRIKRVFKGSSTSHIVSDGMDLALCMINPQRTEMEYAGAYNPLYQIRDQKLTKVKADIMPIGYYVREQSKFKTHTIAIEKDDCYYMFSDGYVDQFGGAHGHKFMMKNFRNLLLEIHQKPMPEQGTLMAERITEYKGTGMQVDDMLVMGFRI